LQTASNNNLALAKRSWGCPQWLALAGAPFLLVEVYAVAGWLRDHPHQLTQYREGHSSPWLAAKTMEGVVTVIAIAVIAHLIRDMRRKRRFFTFDVMFCLVGATIFWANEGCNWFVPLWQPSSYFINLNSVMGYIPLVVNPEAGIVPDPFYFLFMMETFAVLGAALLMEPIMRGVKSLWPRISPAQQFGVLAIFGMIFASFESLVAIPLRLWDWPGVPYGVPMGHGYRYPLMPELFAFGLFFAIPVGLRYFRDSKGLTVLERGMDHYGPARRTTVTFLACYGAVQLATWGPATVTLWPLGWFQDEWRETLPAHINNGVCDKGVVQHTRYGPCPGDPGFRAPFPGSLP
jgi:hypothetical protein